MIAPEWLREEFGWIKKPPAPIFPEDGSERLYAGPEKSHLKKFFTNLKNLKEGKGGKARILHYGDSFIWGDIVTEGLRKNFQKDFGDGGRGILPAFGLRERYFHTHDNLASPDNFLYESIKPWEGENPTLGFLGEFFLPTFNNAHSIHIAVSGSSSWEVAGLILRSYKVKPNRFKIIYNSGEIESPFDIKPNDCQLVIQEIPESNTAKFIFPDAKEFPYIDGIVLERKSGISISNIARTSMELNDMVSIPGKNWACGIGAYKPDLVILQFGVNDAVNIQKSSRRSIDIYEKQLKSLLNQIQSLTPGIEILLISPMEQLSKNRMGEWDVMPELLGIREVNKKVARMTGIAHYDLFSALGGRGQNEFMHQQKMMQSDRIHANRRGGEHIASLIYDDIYHTYKSFLGDEKFRTETKKIEDDAKGNKEILFNSRSYFYFFFIVFILNLIAGKSGIIRVSILLAASVYFYASWDLFPLALIFLSTAVDYFCGLQLGRLHERGKNGVWVLTFSTVSNLSLLFIFKYYAFSKDILGRIFPGISLPILELVLPVGISFYTFQTLSYTIDVYRKVMAPEKNFIKFAFYVSFFPQLIAGPIVRASHFLPFLGNNGSHFIAGTARLKEGILLILFGLIKKLGADWIGSNLVDRFYESPSMHSTGELAAAFYGYGLQIYGDFSGYTDIAIGSAMILGYRLTKNFDSPYIAGSVTEFWRRWHISLSTWFRDYVYIPLGGNRIYIYRNLLITMLLCGIWHGAGYFFFFWGAFHALFLIFERMVGISVNRGKLFLFRWFLTLHIILIGWVLFRTDSISVMKSLIRVLLQWEFISPNLTIDGIFILIGGYLFCFSENFTRKFVLKKFYKANPIFISLLFFLILCFIYHIRTYGPKAFIYFQF